MSKVKLDVLRPWISKKITDILHIEDDVVVEFVYNQLEEDKVKTKATNLSTKQIKFKPIFRTCFLVSMSKEDANQYDRFSKW